MEKDKSPLEELFVDERRLVEETIRNVLTPLLSLSKESDRILPKPAFQKLSVKQRIVAYLLARQAMNMSGIHGASENAQSERIAQDTMADLKTTREELSRLKAKFIEKRDDGSWYLPSVKIMLAAEFLTRKEPSNFPLKLALFELCLSQR